MVQNLLAFFFLWKITLLCFPWLKDDEITLWLCSETGKILVWHGQDTVK